MTIICLNNVLPGARIVCFKMVVGEIQRYSHYCTFLSYPSICCCLLFVEVREDVGKKSEVCVLLGQGAAAGCLYCFQAKIEHQRCQ